MERITTVAALGLVAAENKPAAQQLAATISSWAAERGIPLRAEATLAREGTAGVTAIVVLGGDGLMLRMARRFPGVPLLGINHGHLGFLTVTEAAEWAGALEALVAGAGRIQHSPTLDVTLLRDEEIVHRGWTINDAVVRSEGRMIEVEVYVDGTFVNLYPGDGMIVATPQGSTAYNLAAGGPVLAHGVGGFAVTALCPHTTVRVPLVVSADATVELVLVSDSERTSKLYLDGSDDGLPLLQRGDTVLLQRGTHDFALALLPGTDDYVGLHKRLNFRTRPDAVPSRAAAR